MKCYMELHAGMNAKGDHSLKVAPLLSGPG